MTGHTIDPTLIPMNILEAISKLGFSFKVKEDPRFQPQKYCCISKIENENLTPRQGGKTILRRLLCKRLVSPALAMTAALWIGLCGCVGEPTARQSHEAGTSEVAMTVPAIDEAAPAVFETASFGLG